MNTNSLLTGRVRQVAYVVFAVVSAILGAAGIVAAGTILPPDVRVTVAEVVDTGSKVILYLGVTFGLVAANNVQDDQTALYDDGSYLDADQVAE